MIDLIPLPYKILSGFLVALVLIAVGYYEGVVATKDHAAKVALVAQIKAENIYRAEVARGNELSAKLATAESTINTKTTERMRHVSQVTTGKPCLSAGAVGLLNGTDDQPMPAATGQPTPTDASTLAASDRDVEEWAISASGQYDQCASRLNSLIDYEILK